MSSNETQAKLNTTVNPATGHRELDITKERVEEIFQKLTVLAGGKMEYVSSSTSKEGLEFHVADLGTNEAEVLLGTGLVKDFNEAVTFLYGSYQGYLAAVETDCVPPAKAMAGALKLGLTIGLAAGAKRAKGRGA